MLGVEDAAGGLGRFAGEVDGVKGDEGRVARFCVPFGREGERKAGAEICRADVNTGDLIWLSILCFFGVNNDSGSAEAERDLSRGDLRPGIVPAGLTICVDADLQEPDSVPGRP